MFGGAARVGGAYLSLIPRAAYWTEGMTRARVVRLAAGRVCLWRARAQYRGCLTLRPIVGSCQLNSAAAAGAYSGLEFIVMFALTFNILVLVYIFGQGRAGRSTRPSLNRPSLLPDKRDSGGAVPHLKKKGNA